MKSSKKYLNKKYNIDNTKYSNNIKIKKCLVLDDVHSISIYV